MIQVIDGFHDQDLVMVMIRLLVVNDDLGDGYGFGDGISSIESTDSVFSLLELLDLE